MKLVITIDGPAGVGKSSVSSYLAKELNLLLLKSGSFYRALGLALKADIAKLGLERLENIFEEQGLEWEELWQTIQAIKIYQDGEDILLNGEPVTALLQTPEMDILTPQISKIPVIRHFINNLLRLQAEHKDLIAEGRDMGSIVFPWAQYKFFLEASISVRALRRYQQLDINNLSLYELEQQIEIRDEIDRNKKEGTLKPAKNAHIIDTSRLTLKAVCQIIQQSLND